MRSLEAWIQRLQNLLDFQKDLQLEDVSARLTRYELIELRNHLNTLKELHIYGHLKIGDVISCENTREWMEISNHLRFEGYELQYLPGMVIKIVGDKADAST